jgi:hypothetical protein
MKPRAQADRIGQDQWPLILTNAIGRPQQEAGGRQRMHRRRRDEVSRVRKILNACGTKLVTEQAAAKKPMTETASIAVNAV